MAVAGSTHDIVLDGQGYMLARHAAKAGGGGGGISYRRWSPGAGLTSVYSVNSTSNEALKNTLPANSPQAFKRVFWQRWRGLGKKFAIGGAGDSVQETQQSGQVSDLVALRPALNGAALALAPQGIDAVADAGARDINFAHTTALGTVQVVSFGTKVYVSANPGTNNCGFVLKATAASVVKGMCIWNNLVHVGLGTALNSFDPVAGTFTAFATAHAAELIAPYQGVLMATVGSTLYWYITATTSWSAGITFDSNINAIEEFEGSLYIGTHTTLYRLDGVLKAKSPSTAPTVLDWFDYTVNQVWRVSPFYPSGFWTIQNFVKMTAWRGSLWFFVAGQLLRGQPAGGQKGHIEIEPQPVYGVPLGLGVCGGCLVAVGNVTFGATSAVWVNDGTLIAQGAGLGWWKLADGVRWIFPFSNAGYDQGMVNCLNYDQGTNTTFTRWLLDPSSPLGFKVDNYAQTRTVVTGKVTLPVVFPEDLSSSDKVQAIQLLRLGAEWAIIDGGLWWPTIDNTSTASSLVQFEISKDGGSTWTFLTEPSFGNTGYTLGTANFRANRVELAVPANFATPLYPMTDPATGNAVSDPAYLVRVTWKGLIMPLLRRVWFDYKAVEIGPSSGLMWEMDVRLDSPLVGLDAQADAEAVLTKLNRLQALWSSGRTVLIGDVDQATYSVKVVGYEVRASQQGQMPNLAMGWTATLRLMEVYE